MPPTHAGIAQMPSNRLRALSPVAMRQAAADNIPARGALGVLPIVCAALRLAAGKNAGAGCRPGRGQGMVLGALTLLAAS